VPDRTHAALFYFRGIAYERAGLWNKAEADFRKSLELSPDQANVLNYLGYSMIEKRINLTEAMEMIRKAVELKPNDGYIVDSLGWAHYHLREYDEAAKYLERAVELRPEDPVINDHLGDAYWRAGRRLEAKFQWQHAKDNKPEPADLAKIEKKLKDGLPDEPPVPSTTQSDPVKTVN
jgi:Flp pilus assembly protein TadD